MGKDLSQLLITITSPEERLALLVKAADQGKLKDPALVTEAVDGLRKSKHYGSASRAQHIARQGGLTALANEIFSEMLHSHAKFPSFPFEGWYRSTFREYAEKVRQTDLYLDVILEKLPPNANDVALAARTGYAKTSRMRKVYLDNLERELQNSKTPHKVIFEVQYDLRKAVPDTLADQYLRRAAILAVKAGDFEALIDDLKYSPVPFIHTAQRRKRLLGFAYARQGDHLNAARAFASARRPKPAAYERTLLRRDLLALRYETGAAIAEQELQDPLLAFHVAKKQALAGQEWGAFHRYSAAAVRARQLGLADEANELFYTGVEKGFADDSGPNRMDGGTDWYKVVDFIKSFGTPEQIIELSERYGLHRLGVETAVSMGQLAKARAFADPIFARAAREGNVGNELLALARSVEDAPRVQLYGALLAK